MTIDTTSKITLSLTRILLLLFLFAFLGMYLWGVQLAYDKASQGWAKALLFSLVIFGGGLSWDILKEIARLPDLRMDSFAKAMWLALFWMLLYATFFVIGFNVLGEWAGVATIGVLLYWLITAYALIRFFTTFEQAIKIVLPENVDGAT